MTFLDQLTNCFMIEVTTELFYQFQQNLVVSREFLELRDQIQDLRPDFQVSYAAIMRVEGLNKKYFKEILTPPVGDPLEMLMLYAKTNNLRILDLFVRLDTD